MIPTPHIEVKEKEKIAKTVIMPGDPLRAKYIADNFLEEVECINNVRNMFGYTGKYQGKEVTVMGSGMGMPSIGIYSYELFAFYDVETIVRVGSAGAYTKDVNVYDVVLATDCYSESTYAKVAFGYEDEKQKATEEINQRILKTAKDKNVDLKVGTIHSSDVFYRKNKEDYIKINEQHNCLCVEMESFALFANAKFLNKKAACLLTVSDSLVTNEATSSEERQKGFNEMIKLALDSLI